MRKLGIIVFLCTGIFFQSQLAEAATSPKEEGVIFSGAMNLYWKSLYEEATGERLGGTNVSSPISNPNPNFRLGYAFPLQTFKVQPYLGFGPHSFSGVFEFGALAEFFIKKPRRIQEFYYSVGLDLRVLPQFWSKRNVYAALGIPLSVKHFFSPGLSLHFLIEPALIFNYNQWQGSNKDLRKNISLRSALGINYFF